MTKTIGVLGGMGPYATVDFMKLLLDVTNAEKESDHIHVIIDNNPRMPSRTRAYLFGEADPVPEMKKGVLRLLRAGVDFVVVPCNSAHYFLPCVFEGISIEYIDMIEATCNIIRQKGWNTVGILGGEVTVHAGLYDQVLKKNNIKVIHVSEDDQSTVRTIIESVKRGRITDDTIKNLSVLYEHLVAMGAQALVLACTELQAVSDKFEAKVPIVDSLRALACAAVDKATR